MGEPGRHHLQRTIEVNVPRTKAHEYRSQNAQTQAERLPQALGPGLFSHEGLSNADQSREYGDVLLSAVWDPRWVLRQKKDVCGKASEIPTRTAHSWGFCTGAKVLVLIAGLWGGKMGA